MKNMMMELLERWPELSEDKIITLFCAKTGIREKTAKEYMQEIKNMLNIAEEQKEKQKKIE